MRVRIIALALALATAGCTEAPPASEPSGDREIERTVEELAAAAKRSEPALTLALTRLVASRDAALVGLEHRFKKPSSLERKIRARLADDPERTLATVDIVDALRYTIVVDDQPTGHYVTVTAEILRGIEADGAEVVRVKNYWPAGDNYSGVNVVLRNRDGFQWEVQFHTGESASVRDAWHGHYRVLRDSTNSIETRRAMFDEMTPPWDAVAVPEGVLEPKNLHATERIILHQRP